MQSIGFGARTVNSLTACTQQRGLGRLPLVHQHSCAFKRENSRLWQRLRPVLGTSNHIRRTCASAVSLAVEERKATPGPDSAQQSGLAAAVALKGAAKVVLKRGKSTVFRNGHPMVYSGAIDRVVGKPQPVAGDAVLVTDGAEAPIAWGIFNPHSMFRVRIMQMQHELSQQHQQSTALDIPHLISARLQTAVQLRGGLGLGTNPAHVSQDPSTQNLTHSPDQATDHSSDETPSSNSLQNTVGSSVGHARHTDVFRVVNSEGDRLSGLVVDRVGEQLVVSSSAAWVERYRETITKELSRICNLPTTPVWRQAKDMLKEEGIELSLDAPQAPEPAKADADVQVTENGIKFLVSPSTGQKTGFYADQRDSRLAMRQLAKGKRMLDLCCYTGGFALNALAGGATHVAGFALSALAGGATHVTGVDSSVPALALAEQNAQLNNYSSDQYTFLKDDIAKYMQQQLEAGSSWDLIVLDPPKLAPNRKSLDRALAKYRKLNTLAMRLIKPGGLLMTCSCSGAVSEDAHFIPMLREAAKSAGRHISVLRSAGAAPDHPIDPGYPEGAYLKNLLLLVR